MASAVLTRDPTLYYLPRQIKFYSLSFHVIYIQRLLPNTWASQQHKYLKHGGREPVASKKWRWGKLSQISQGKLSAPKYCEFSKVYVVFHCQNDLKTQKTCRNKLTLSSGTLMFRLRVKFSVFRNFFDLRNFYRRLYFLTLQRTRVNQYCCSIKFGYHFSCNWMWCDNLPRLRGKWSLTTIVLRLKEIRYCSIVARGSLKTLAHYSLPKYWMQKNTKIMKENVWQLAPGYRIFSF